MASITRTSRFDRIVRILAFIQYALPVGIAGAVLREAGLPRLFGPALLTLVVYVITVMRDSADPVLENRRLLQELAVLGTVGGVADPPDRPTDAGFDGQPEDQQLHG